MWYKKLCYVNILESEVAQGKYVGTIFYRTRIQDGFESKY